MKKTNAFKISLLPQYIDSELMYDRFSDSTLDGVSEVERKRNTPGAMKEVDFGEISYLNLDFFDDHKNKIQEDFFTELSAKIGESRCDLFCNLICDYWMDGGAKRKSKEIEALRVSIKDYIMDFGFVSSPENIQVTDDVNQEILPSFYPEEIDEIIRVNREMMDGYFPEWLDGIEPKSELSMNDIYCRRGLSLDKELEVDYHEKSYLSSYSLSISITEQFAKTYNKPHPAIISSKLSNFRSRILFFAPFLKGVDVEQYEVGVIPHWQTLKVISQGEYGGISEYLLESEEYLDNTLSEIENLNSF